MNRYFTFAVVLAIFFMAPLDRSLAVHDEIGKVSCLDCHYRLPFEGSRATFIGEAEKACTGCHKVYHGAGKGPSHPVKIIPTMAVPPDMPLDKEGRITCVTCHTYHFGYKDEKGTRLLFLRRTRGKTLCFSCHNNQTIRP